MISNTAVPRYYGAFREEVRAGRIPVCEEIDLQMHRIDAKIEDPALWYDDAVVEGFIAYCEAELTLTDGSDLHLLDSFKLGAEDIFGWYYFVEQLVPVPNEDGSRVRYERRQVRKRLCNKQYLIVSRGAAKTMYASCLQSYFLVMDTSTTHQIATAFTMRQADETLSPIRTAITRARGPLYQFLTDGSIRNTTGSKVDRVKLASTKKGIENFITNSRIETVPMSIDKPFSYTQVRRMCERIRRDTGFQDRITPIRFRTTVLTDIYDQTKDIKQAQAAAGHTTAAMTLKYYVKGRSGTHEATSAVERAYGIG